MSVSTIQYLSWLVELIAVSFVGFVKKKLIIIRPNLLSGWMVIENSKLTGLFELRLIKFILKSLVTFLKNYRLLILLFSIQSSFRLWEKDKGLIINFILGVFAHAEVGIVLVEKATLCLQKQKMIFWSLK